MPHRAIVLTGIFVACLTWSCGNDEPILITQTPYPEIIDFQPEWVPQGREVVYTHVERFAPPDSVQLLFAIDVATGAKRLVGSGFKPAISPDLSWLAFGRAGNIYAQPWAGGQVTQLTHNGESYSPSWSPNSERIAYDVKTSPLDSSGVWSMRVDGSGRQQLIRSNGAQPDWHPGGESLAFTFADPDPEIAVFDLDDSAATILTANDIGDLDPAWSPDGTSIAWSVYEPRRKRPDVWILNRVTGQRHRLVAGGYDPTWSPDGSMLAYTGYNADSDNWTIWLVNANGSNPRPLTRP